jgi:hypothetical protein
MRSFRPPASAPLLQTGKWAVLLAIVLTSICTTALLGWQLALVVAGADWTLISVGQVLESATHSPRQYATAGSEPGSALDAASVLDWLLELPATFVLASALGLLAVYYAWLNSLEKTWLGL